jgi:histidinol dehydrogenase
MKTIVNPSTQQWRQISKRPALNVIDLEATVQSVFNAVGTDGDEALKRFTQHFDNVNIDQFEVNDAEWSDYINQVDNSLKVAIETAAKNIECFHKSQLRVEPEVETTHGVCCWRRSVPIQNVGLYIPGGTAPLFSTVLMLGIPANIVGCPICILCTPPDETGKINPAIAFAAKVAGIQRIFKVGGAQAIAAMSIGTATIPKMDKLFGPGNQYVTAAKVYAQRLGLAIDMPAGPSEVLVAADNSINPRFVAADLLAQAEHGVDSQVVFLTNSEDYTELVTQEVQAQLEKLPRAEIAIDALKNSSFVILEPEQWPAFIDTYAPEHLMVMGKYEELVVSKVTNAGSVFIGQYSAESFGDYASGTNHTLPTAGYARAYSGVSTDSFVKKITYQRVSETGLRNLGQTVVTMTEAESLQAHANAVKVRLESVDQTSHELPYNAENRSLSFIRPALRKLIPYSSARDEFEGEATVFLDANENGLLTAYNRYPDPLQRALKKEIARIKNFATENLCLGNGSDEVLDLIYRLVCEPGLDKVAYLNPSYGMYNVLAGINQLETVAIDLDVDFTISADNILEKAKSAKLLVLCNPNNPTGMLYPKQDLIRIIQAFNGVVVVDEAYIDFCPEESVANLVTNYPNLIVTQTLSKSFGMAGLRIGMAIANKQWIHKLNSIKPPYNLSAIVQEKARDYLNSTNWNGVTSTIITERDRVEDFLRNLSIVKRVVTSAANFILFEVDNATQVYQFLASKGVVVRNRSSQFNCTNMLRVSIGTKQENDLFIEQMKQL